MTQLQWLCDVALAFIATRPPTEPLNRFKAAIEGKDWDYIRTYRVSPRDFEDPATYRDIAQASSFLRKYPGLPSTVDKSQVALQGFLKSEAQNYRTNQYFHRVLHFPVDMTSFDEEVRSRAFLAKRWITKVVGNPYLRFPEIRNGYDTDILSFSGSWMNGRFGPGAVAEAPMWGTDVISPLHKIVFPSGRTPRFSSDLYRYFVEDTAIGRARRISQSLSVSLKGSRFTTVPKDGSTDRGISIEPGDNVIAQLAIGTQWKHDLKKVGVRLLPSKGRTCAPFGKQFMDGQELHRLLAKNGSQNGTWVTIDLSSASDLNARVPLKFLLGEWGDLCDAVRSHKVTLPNGKVHLLEMFSAMGNGFTFEALTLLVLSLAYASGYVPGVDAFAFGDDIIVSNDYRLDNYLALLRTFGHTPNEKKSFISGPFRESCGGDYWDGQDVRPVEVDKELDSPLQYMALHNNLSTKFCGIDEVLKLIVKRVDRKWRLFGPEGSDGTFWHATRRSPYKGYRNFAVHGLPPRREKVDGFSKGLNTMLYARVVTRGPTIPFFPSLKGEAYDFLLVAVASMSIPLDGVPVRTDQRHKETYDIGWYT